MNYKRKRPANENNFVTWPPIRYVITVLPAELVAELHKLSEKLLRFAKLLAVVGSSAADHADLNAMTKM